MNKARLRTTINRHTEQQIDELQDAGHYNTQASLVEDAIEMLHHEKVGSIKLTPKARKALMNMERNLDMNGSDIINTLILNHYNRNN